ncbi:alpha/beta hydrolase [Shimazuella kribbensis]|uniref:alpha/beta hydrolase n=1 Tax=Shimazuella kribbensis TaxID=139808 RepID=UPI00040E7745|nr:alpha/beta fold hydrolase [Shimazuella kribbensis]
MSVSGSEPIKEILNREIHAPIDGPTQVVETIHASGLGPDMYRGAKERLEHQGISLDALNLKGHGTTPDDLHGVPYQDWVDQIVQRVHFLHDKGKEIVLVGGSMGGPISVLSILKLQELGVDVKGLVFVNPAFELRLSTIENWYVHYLARFGRFTPWRQGVKDGMGYQEVEYNRYPGSFVIQLKKLGMAASLALSELKETFHNEIVMIQGEKDEIVSVERNRQVARLLDATYRPIPQGTHAFEKDGIYFEVEALVIEEVSKMFRR